MRARSSSTKRLGVETVQRQRREHRVHHLGGVEVLLDRRRHAGELHLDGERRRPSVVTARCTWPMLAAATGRSVQSANTRSGSAAELLATTPAASDGAIGAASACSAASAGLGLVGQPLGDEADHLAGLHQHALHLAELLGDVLGGADGELLVELGPALGRGADAAHLAAGVARRVAGRQLPHRGRDG